MTLWPPRGPKVQDEIDAHSTPGSASAPGDMGTVQGQSGLGQVGSEGAMHQVRNPTLRQGSTAPGVCQLQAPHPQGSVWSLPEHSTCWMVPGTLVITPDQLETLFWLLSPRATGSVPSPLAHGYTGWAEASRGLWLKIYLQSTKSYWPASYFEYAVNLASRKKKDNFNIQLGMDSRTDCYTQASLSRVKIYQEPDQ